MLELCHFSEKLSLIHCPQLILKDLQSCYKISWGVKLQYGNMQIVRNLSLKKNCRMTAVGLKQNLVSCCLQLLLDNLVLCCLQLLLDNLISCCLQLLLDDLQHGNETYVKLPYWDVHIVRNLC